MFIAKCLKCKKKTKVSNSSEDPLDLNNVDPINEGVMSPKKKKKARINSEVETRKISVAQRDRRSRIPNKPNENFNIVSFVLDIIGQDVTKLSLPVHVSEPLSFLQRLAEHFEYSYLLDLAAKTEDLFEQIAYVAAFSVSAYAETDRRLTKPSNPIQGETYEFDRSTDLGWKFISEQVSHHPPISVFHCESSNWTCFSTYQGTSKFSGNTITIAPEGMTCVEFHKCGSKYSWNRISTKVRNMIIGKMYMEHIGTEEIIGEGKAKQIRAEMLYHGGSGSIFKSGSSSNRKVEGKIFDDKNKIKFYVHGTWDDKVVKSNLRPREKCHSANNRCTTLWTRNPIVEGSEHYYNFTVFACQLNEQENNIAPTDSRYRPDQRFVEIGKWSDANKEKRRLETKQRSARNTLNSSGIKHIPRWFKPATESNPFYFPYGGEYWECKDKQDWSRCPDIF